MGRSLQKLRKGRRFGRLTVLAQAENHVSGEAQWLCVCDCGVEKVASGWRLRAGRTSSCGCLRREKGRARGRQNQVHGHLAGGRLTRTYVTWRAMIDRCTYPSHIGWKYYGGRGWKYYGGRGIKVCNRWQESFENFLEDMGTRPPGRSLDRCDPDGDYTKMNCRWATSTEQGETRRDSIILEFNGQKKSLKRWSKELGMSYACLYCRWKKGWPIEKILSKRNFRMKE